MQDYLPFVLIGLTTGAVYALAAMGLVLTYSTSGVFNFAHGAVGMFATYVFYTLRVDAKVPTALAAAIAVVIVAPLIGVVLDRAMLRRLHGAGAASYVVASLGLLVALQALATAIYGGDTRQVEAIFPRSTYRLPGVNVGIDQTIVVAIAVLAGFGLAYFFRRTHLGLQTRAVVGDPELTEMVGSNARMVTTTSWMLGASFATLSGILFAPFTGLDSILLTLLVVQAFGAAIVGGLRSLPLTNLGAYGIAIAAALSAKWVATVPSLVGLPSALPFIVLFLVLVVSPKGHFAEVAKEDGASRLGRVRVSKVPLKTIAAMAVIAALLPAVLDGSQLLTATTTLAFVLVFASLSLLVGLSRQVSLAHAVFAAFGASTLGHLLQAGFPYPIALPLAALVMVPVGALLAIPAIRLSGLFLALATFGFGVLTQYLIFPTSFSYGQDGTVFVARPSMFASDTRFYYLLLAIVLLGVLLVEITRVSRLGRLLRALADSPTAVQSVGVNPTASRVIVFCLSAFLAAVAGGLIGSSVQAVNTVSFNFFQSLIWLTVLVAAGTATLSGSILAALLFIATPAVLTSATFIKYQPVAFGVAAMLLAQAPNGLAGLLFRRPDFSRLADRSAWRLERSRRAERYRTVATHRGL